MASLTLASSRHVLASARALTSRHVVWTRPAPVSAAAPPAAPARRAVTASAAASAAPGGSSSSGQTFDEAGSHAGGAASAASGFSQLEALLTTNFGGGPQGDWREVEGCWVLAPPEGTKPRALVHFTGGAFVGAAPQLAYRPLLEALAARGALVVATPYATSLDHLGAVDEVYFKYARCLKQLGPGATALPAYGLGHSFGALSQLLLSSRYLLSRAGNVLMSFNNRPATDSIPLLSPYIAPSVRALGPILKQLSTSPLRSNLEGWLDMLKSASPAAVKQVIPVLEQLTPMYLDISTGVAEFTPPPEETRRLIREGYNVPRNLLLRFADDSIDQTPQLASTLQSSAVGGNLELVVKTLPGDHVRPLQQDLAGSGVSPDLLRFAGQATQQAVTQSESLLGQLGAFAARAGLSQEATSQLSSVVRAGTEVAKAVGSSLVSVDAEQQIEALAAEIADFMKLDASPGVKALPAPPPDAAAAAALPPPSSAA